MVIVEQLNCISYRFYWILQSLMDQNVKVYLFVPPINLEKLLKACKESHDLIKRAFDDVLDHGLLLSVIKVFTDP